MGRAARLGRASTAATADTAPIMSAVALYFTMLAVSAVALIVVLARDRDLSVMEDLVVALAFSAVVLGWCLPSLPALTPLLRSSPRALWYGVAVLAAVPTFLIASLIVSVLERVFEVPTIWYTDAFFAEGFGWTWIVLLICVQPGIFEEIAFRGVIMSSLARVLSAKETLLVSALAFAILHLSVPSLPHLFLIGLVLGWLRLRTGSLYPGMLLHFTHNLLVVLSEQYWEWLPW